jgi:hypothetical protein
VFVRNNGRKGAGAAEFIDITTIIVKLSTFSRQAPMDTIDNKIKKRQK